MNRDQRAALGRETVAIIEAGGYHYQDHWVDIKQAIDGAVSQTRMIEPQGFPSVPSGLKARGEISVSRETTLTAARRLLQDNATPVMCLNFASAKNPGGGFLGGSQAQEESLARSSALYACLLAADTYYQNNRRCGTTLYTDHMIYSPQVPVFRADSGELLQQPYPVNFVTAPAVNYGAYKKQESGSLERAYEVMRIRIGKLLQLSAALEQTRLILGAWGCGVFGNDPKDIAELFKQQLDDGYRYYFDQIVFAIPGSKSDSNFRVFSEVLL